MMLVNNPGDWSATYAPLLHAPWHGWTFTDLVFPFFLWIVGVAMLLSTARRIEQGQGRADLLRHLLRRSFILFALGLFLNSFGYFIDGSLARDGFSTWLHKFLTTVRIPGVLQRIAVCYGIAGTVVIFLKLRGQLIALAGCLVLYWCLMMLVPVPGFGPGVLEKEGNLAQYVDNAVLNGPFIGTHVWKSARTWDPEGIVSTLPAVATCLFGVMVGHVLRSSQTAEGKTAWIFVGGCLLLLTGQILNGWMPINKNLWTTSYAVFMAGMAMLCFATCYWFVDVQGWRRWTKPFEIYGMNAITVFVLAGVLGRLVIELKVPNSAGAAVALKTWLYQGLFVPLASPKNASLLWALMCVLVLYGVAYLMYRRKWIIKF